MALKSKEWFYKQCLAELKEYGRYSHLAWSALQKGIGQSDGTRGHVNQAIGVCQEFLAAHSKHINAIRAADATSPFDIIAHPAIQKDLKKWIAGRTGTYGRSAYGYNYTTFKKHTTAALGGSRKGGGGADDEFKRVLRLMAEFV